MPMPPYVPKANPTKVDDLDQGDLLAHLVRPKVPVAISLQQRVKSAMEHAKPENLKNPDKMTRVQVEAELVELALVVSNSCDIAQGSPLLIAPVEPFKIPEKAQTDAAKWELISSAGTGGASPRAFYLPGATELGISRVSARLDSIFPITWEYLSRCMTEGKTRRVAGL